MATKGRRRRSEEQDDSVIANRVLQDIINNSSDDFRRYLEQSMGGGSAQGFTPAPQPMPLAAGVNPPYVLPPGDFPQNAGTDQELNESRIVPRADAYPRGIYYPHGIPGRLDTATRTMPTMPIDSIATPMPTSGDQVGPDMIQYEDDSTGPKYRIPTPNIGPRRHPGEQQIDTLLRALGLM